MFVLLIPKGQPNPNLHRNSAIRQAKSPEEIEKQLQKQPAKSQKQVWKFADLTTEQKRLPC